MVMMFSFLTLSACEGDKTCKECKKKAHDSYEEWTKQNLPFKVQTGDDYTIYYDFEDDMDWTEQEGQALFVDSFLKSGLIEKKSDIIFTKDTIIVRDKKCDGGKKSTPLPEGQTSFFETPWVPGPLDNDRYDNISTEDCKDNCSWLQCGANMLCCALPTKLGQNSCLAMVQGLYLKCNRCCNGAGFRNNCTRSIEDIIRSMERYG